MRITLVAVGRAKDGPARELYEDYVKRLRSPLELREVEERRPLPAAQLKEREGALILAALPEGARLVALDEGGRGLDSRAFAERLGRWRDEGMRDLAFAVGGAECLSREVLDRAALRLSLGPMTWPHLLVRPLVAEQLYRAQCILDGHPYHRG